RKARHLQVALQLEEAWGAVADDIAEVLASHYTDAYLAEPDAPDAGAIRENARSTLVRAAERAASLAANTEALHYFERAAELADEVEARADLLAQDGEMAWRSGTTETATDHFEAAIAL